MTMSKAQRKINSQRMKRVIIKRIKRNKKKITAGEKVMAGLGLGSSIMGLGSGGSASSSREVKPAIASVSTTKTSGQSSTAKIKQKLTEIFGVPEAKAAYYSDSDMFYNAGGGYQTSPMEGGGYNLGGGSGSSFGNSSSNPISETTKTTTNYTDAVTTKEQNWLGDATASSSNATQSVDQEAAADAITEESVSQAEASNTNEEEVAQDEIDAAANAQLDADAATKIATINSTMNVTLGQVNETTGEITNTNTNTTTTSKNTSQEAISTAAQSATTDTTSAQSSPAGSTSSISIDTGVNAVPTFVVSAVNEAVNTAEQQSVDSAANAQLDADQSTASKITVNNAAVAAGIATVAAVTDNTTATYTYVGESSDGTKVYETSSGKLQDADGNAYTKNSSGDYAITSTASNTSATSSATTSTQTSSVVDGSSNTDSTTSNLISSIQEETTKSLTVALTGQVTTSSGEILNPASSLTGENLTYNGKQIYYNSYGNLVDAQGNANYNLINGQIVSLATSAPAQNAGQNFTEPPAGATTWTDNVDGQKYFKLDGKTYVQNSEGIYQFVNAATASSVVVSDKLETVNTDNTTVSSNSSPTLSNGETLTSADGNLWKDSYGDLYQVDSTTNKPVPVATVGQTSEGGVISIRFNGNYYSVSASGVINEELQPGVSGATAVSTDAAKYIVNFLNNNSQVLSNSQELAASVQTNYSLDLASTSQTDSSGSIANMSSGQTQIVSMNGVTGVLGKNTDGSYLFVPNDASANVGSEILGSITFKDSSDLLQALEKTSGSAQAVSSGNSDSNSGPSYINEEKFKSDAVSGSGGVGSSVSSGLAKATAAATSSDYDTLISSASSETVSAAVSSQLPSGVPTGSVLNTVDGSYTAPDNTVYTSNGDGSYSLVTATDSSNKGNSSAYATVTGEKLSTSTVALDTTGLNSDGSSIIKAALSNNTTSSDTATTKTVVGPYGLTLTQTVNDQGQTVAVDPINVGQTYIITSVKGGTIFHTGGENGDNYLVYTDSSGEKQTVEVANFISENNGPISGVISTDGNVYNLSTDGTTYNKNVTLNQIIDVGGSSATSKTQTAAVVNIINGKDENGSAVWTKRVIVDGKIVNVDQTGAAWDDSGNEVKLTVEQLAGINSATTENAKIIEISNQTSSTDKIRNNSFFKLAVTAVNPLSAVGNYVLNKVDPTQQQQLTQFLQQKGDGIIEYDYTDSTTGKTQIFEVTKSQYLAAQASSKGGDYNKVLTQLTTGTSTSSSNKNNP